MLHAILAGMPEALLCFHWMIELRVCDADVTPRLPLLIIHGSPYHSRGKEPIRKDCTSPTIYSPLNIAPSCLQNQVTRWHPSSSQKMRIASHSAQFRVWITPPKQWWQSLCSYHLSNKSFTNLDLFIFSLIICLLISRLINIMHAVVSYPSLFGMNCVLCIHIRRFPRWLQEKFCSFFRWTYILLFFMPIIESKPSQRYYYYYFLLHIYIII